MHLMINLPYQPEQLRLTTVPRTVSGGWNSDVTLRKSPLFCLDMSQNEHATLLGTTPLRAFRSIQPL
jgi:hypothetical protein